LSYNFEQDFKWTILTFSNELRHLPPTLLPNRKLTRNQTASIGKEIINIAPNFLSPIFLCSAKLRTDKKPAVLPEGGFLLLPVTVTKAACLGNIFLSQSG